MKAIRNGVFALDAPTAFGYPSTFAPFRRLGPKNNFI